MEFQLLDDYVFVFGYQKQVMDIHVVAYFLYILNHHVIDAFFTLKTFFPGVFILFFKHYKVDHLMELSQFHLFCAQKKNFNAESPCWAYISELA